MTERLTGSQLVARCANAWEAMPPVTQWRHKKTGGIYETQGVALTSDDLTPVVIYMNTDGNGPSFTRPASEFLDGRFERINTFEKEEGK